MDAIDVLRDLATRPRDAARGLRPSLDAEVLRAHPGGHDNSVAWLLWHAARETDAQLADLMDDEQVWTAQGFDTRFDLGEAAEGVGYGHSSEQARAIVVDDPELLLEYIDAATEELTRYLGTLGEADLDEVIDEQWDPPVTRGTRLVSIIDDAAQHVGQAAYVVGMPRRD